MLEVFGAFDGDDDDDDDDNVFGDCTGDLTVLEWFDEDDEDDGCCCWPDCSIDLLFGEFTLWTGWSDSGGSESLFVSIEIVRFE